MKRKRLLGAVLGGLLLAQSVFGAVVAFAANTTDTDWGYSSDGENVYQYNVNNSYTYTTKARHKDNATSIYVKYQNGSVGSIRVYAYKSYVDSNSGGSLATYPSSRNNWLDYYVYTVGLERTMYNTVNESGCPYAYLKINTNGVSGWAFGLWSPDSTREYN